MVTGVRRAVARIFLPLIGALASGPAFACACGCGVFDIGASSAFPNQADSGWSVYLRYNYLDQNRNWEGSSSAPASDNLDKEIRTGFYTFGGQYMISHDWGVMLEVPVYQRSFTSTGDGTAFPAGSIFTKDITELGDAMVMGVYSGFDADMSTGVTFGLKLPTGNYTGPIQPAGSSADGRTDPIYDRDTLPGSGSADLVVGAYHVGPVTSDGKLAYFVQARYEVAFLERDGSTGSYRPGNEFDAGGGLTYSLGSMGVFDRVSPVLQIVASDRSQDGGTGSSFNSGYRRLLVAPGIDVRIRKWKIFADVSFPVAQNVRTDLPSSGNVGQLVASSIWRLQIGYDF